MPVNAVRKATEALLERFPGATIESEKIAGADRYQVFIVSEAFAKVRPFRRQDVVWEILKMALDADEMMKIVFVMPLSPSEIRSKAEVRSRAQEQLQAQ